jgi:hypothetical protein
VAELALWARLENGRHCEVQDYSRETGVEFLALLGLSSGLEAVACAEPGGTTAAMLPSNRTLAKSAILGRLRFEPASAAKTTAVARLSA